VLVFPRFRRLLSGSVARLTAIKVAAEHPHTAIRRVGRAPAILVSRCARIDALLLLTARVARALVGARARFAVGLRLRRRIGRDGPCRCVRVFFLGVPMTLPDDAARVASRRRIRRFGTDGRALSRIGGLRSFNPGEARARNEEHRRRGGSALRERAHAESIRLSGKHASTMRLKNRWIIVAPVWGRGSVPP